MNLHSNVSIAIFLGLKLLLASCIVQAQGVGGSQFVGTARITLVPNIESQALDNQIEASFYLDAMYLEKFGVGFGYINQTLSFANDDEISNDIFHYSARYSAFPQFLPGKLSFVFGGYHQENNDYTVETTTTSASSSGGGPGSGSDSGSGRTSRSIIRNVSTLDVINPELQFLNYSKTFYLDLGYANSDYHSSEQELVDLEVEQWTATIGFALNQQYDWLQIRLYAIDLSNDMRSSGVDKTESAILSWTHWLRNKPARLESITLKALVGERIYAVDSEIRKVFNLADLQKGGLVFGTNWSLSESTRLYLYAGYEAYEDLADAEDYNSAFADAGISYRW